MHFGEVKTKPILFISKRYLKLAEKIDVRYKEIKNKQHSAWEVFGVSLRWNNVWWNNGSQNKVSLSKLDKEIKKSAVIWVA